MLPKLSPRLRALPARFPERAAIALFQGIASRCAALHSSFASRVAAFRVLPHPRQFDPAVVSSLESFSGVAGTLVIVVGCLIVIGRALDLGALAGTFPGATKANAALCFILAGISLRLARAHEVAPRMQLAAQRCALAVVTIGLLTLAEYLPGWNLNIDELLLRESPATAGFAPPGRMPPAEAVSFVLLGLALPLLDHGSRRWRRVSQALTLTAALISGQALLGHAYGVMFYSVPSYRYTQVGGYTALAFTILCLGMLASRPTSGVMAIFTSDGAGGQTARRLLPAAVAVLSVLGWLGLEGERAGLYDTAAGVALVVAATLIFFAILIVWNGGALERLEEERAQVIREQTARTHAEAAERRATFLAQASAALSASLDYEFTLKSVANLAVPRMADWCTVHSVEGEGVIRQLAVAHVDASKVAQAWEMAKRNPVSRGAAHGPGRVIRTGESELMVDIPDTVLQAFSDDEEQLGILRVLGFVSYMAVPLIARGQTLGAIAFMSADPGHRFDLTDLALAEELARRAALAIDNARLYEAEGRARAEAEAASRAKDAFLAIVSHELRTPLSPILVWSRMLRRCSLGEEKTRRALETIERCARSQAQLIEDLLDVSRIIEGKLRLDARPIALAPVVQAALEVVRPAADAKEIQLRTLLDAEAGVVVGDPERLKQVIWNLAYNAVKFTPKGGRVQIVLERVESHVEIRVSDTGQGISPEFLPHVFQRFEQADVTATRTHGGLGLGLAIVRHLVDLHRGSVEVESPGESQGAVFTVKLPLAPPRTAGTTGMRPATPGSETTRDDLPSLHGVRVLVVDDEPDSNDAVGTLLASCGAEVQVAGSATQALETLSAWSPHVLVTDIAMPDEDGYDLIAKVRNLPGAAAQIFAVALTAYASRDDRIRVLSAGFQAHVPKPVDPIEVTTVVANLGHTARRVRDGVVAGDVAAGSGIAET